MKRRADNMASIDVKKDDQIREFVTHTLADAEKLGELDCNLALALVVMALEIERGTIAWDEKKKVCVKLATGEAQRLLH
jgi:hypothetical protein